MEEDNLFSIVNYKNIMLFFFFFSGGSIGKVLVTWGVTTKDRTATYGQDYIADGATLVFDIEQTRRCMKFCSHKLF